MFPRRPERPSPGSPSVPPPPAAFNYFPPPWPTGCWQGASFSEHTRAPSCLSWGTMGPSVKIKTLSCTCRWENCTCIAVLVAARSGHPSTGQFRGPPAVENSIMYVRGSLPVAMAYHHHLPSASLPCCVFMFTDNNPSTISSLHYLRWIQPLYLSCYGGNSLVILLLYAASDCVPTTWHGWKTMPTVFPKLSPRPTLSNRPTKVLKAPWRHHGSDDVNMLSST